MKSIESIYTKHHRTTNKHVIWVQRNTLINTQPWKNDQAWQPLQLSSQLLWTPDCTSPKLDPAYWSACSTYILLVDERTQVGWLADTMQPVQSRSIEPTRKHLPTQPRLRTATLHTYQRANSKFTTISSETSVVRYKKKYAQR